MSPDFRAGERIFDPILICTECGGRAEGNAAWTDGSGDICDRCVQEQDETDKDL